MANPTISVAKELASANHPEFFRASQTQIAAVMGEVAGIPEELIDATQISFEIGNEQDDTLTRTSDTKYVVSMRALRHNHTEGRLELSAVWSDIFPENDLVAAAHLAVAKVIGGIKVEHDLGGPPRVRAIDALGYSAIMAGAEGNIGHFLTNGNWLIAGVAALDGVRRGVKIESRAVLKSWEEKTNPIIANFMEDRAVPATLKGALAFEFRR